MALNGIIKALQVKGKKGARCFLAVAGGINTPAYLGSRATFPGGKLGGIQVPPVVLADVLSEPYQLYGQASEHPLNL